MSYKFEMQFFISKVHLRFLKLLLLLQSVFQSLNFIVGLKLEFVLELEF